MLAGKSRIDDVLESSYEITILASNKGNINMSACTAMMTPVARSASGNHAAGVSGSNIPALPERTHD